MIKKLFSLLVVVVLVALSGLFYLHFKSSKKIGYVTTLKVFEEFKLKKELESNYKKTLLAKQAYLDSLKTGLERLVGDEKNTSLSPEKVNTYKQAYLIKKNQISEEGQKLYEDYNTQIWKQLNQYIEDYGKEHGYDYVLGASGQGSIMYANSTGDLTNEIINYVNTKYSEKKNS